MPSLSAPRDLIVLEKCRNELAAMKDLKTVMDIRDKAVAIRGYLKAKGDARSSQNSAACIAALAEARAGQLLGEGRKTGEIANRGRSKGSVPSTKVVQSTQPLSQKSLLVTFDLEDRQTLEDLGIGKNESARLKQAATVLEEDPSWFDRHREECSSFDRDFTQQAVIRRGREIDHAKIGDVEVAPPKGLYDVLIIDPPWPMQKLENERDGRFASQIMMEYPTMTEAELDELYLPVSQDCHVWVWTTQRFLPMALRLVPKWGLKYSCTFVWHKTKGMQTPGMPYFNCEFALYCRYGTPKFKTTKNFFTCYNWGRGKHSEKPAEFYELVKRVTSGKRLDMFGRREIAGFDSWGNESPKKEP